MTPKRRRTLVLSVVLAAVAAIVVVRLLDTGIDRTTLSLSAFRTRLDDGGVVQATLLDQDHVVQGRLRDGTAFEVRFPSGYTAASRSRS